MPTSVTHKPTFTALIKGNIESSCGVTFFDRQP